MVFFKFSCLGVCTFLCSLSLSAWEPPSLISNGPASLTPTALGLTMDQYSNATIGYLGGELGIETNLFSASLPANAPHWNAPISLFSGSSPQFPTPPLLFNDENGYVNALWANFYFNIETSFVDLFSLSLSVQNTLAPVWSAPDESTPFAGFTHGGDCCVDQTGNRLALLALGANSSTDTGLFDLFMFSHPAGGSWCAPIYLGSDTGSHSPVVFCKASQGFALIGWKLSAPLSLNTARYDFALHTVTQIDSLLLPSGTVDIGFAQIALAPNGNTTIIFSVQIGTNSKFILYSAFLPAGSHTWTVPAIVSNPDHMIESSYVAIKADQNGDALLLWGEGLYDGPVFMRAAQLPFGEAIQQITDLTSSSPSVATNYRSGVSLSVDKFGNAVAVWQLDEVSGNSVIQVSSKEVNQEWEAAETITTTGLFPTVALSDQGTAVIAWVDEINGNLYSSKENGLFSLDSPLNFAGYLAQDFSGELSLNLHWFPSNAPHVACYEIFKDGELIASVSGQGPFVFSQIIDCAEDAFAEYVLVAVASNGNKSLPSYFFLTP